MMQQSKITESDKIIKIHATLNNVIFPKGGFQNIVEPTFGIVSWTIITVDERNPEEDRFGTITVKGTYPTNIRPKSNYIIIAKEVEHPQYGTQYDLIYFNEEFDLTKASNQRAFLKTFLTDNQIEEFFKIFPNPIQTLEKGDPKELTKIYGVGDYIANCILERYEQKKDVGQVYLELDGIGLSSNFITKLVQKYKNPSLIVSKVKENPYSLIKDIDGVGFLTADAVAQKAGFSKTDVRRIKSFIIWFLNKEGDEGNSYISAQELNANIFETLGSPQEIVENYDVPEDADGSIPRNNIAKAIQELQDERTIILEDGERKANRRVYLKKFYELERDIAYHLKRLLNAHSDFKIENFDEKIKKAEEEQGFEFTQEQIDGIKLGCEKQVCMITGLAGSGKSSLVNGILTVLNNYTFAQCALSGKAAARLQEVTGVSGKTIHRLLEYNADGFMRNEENPLTENIIVLDEISLVGGEIFLDLLKAIPNGSKLIMLRDHRQLASVGFLNLAHDMMNSNLIPVVKLQQVHRQAKSSGILTVAYQVRNGYQLYDDYAQESVETVGDKQDMIIDVCPESDDDRDKVLAYFEEYYNSPLVGRDIEKIQVISPVKERGDTCVFNLNQDIQELVNPIEPFKNNFVIKKKRKKTDKDLSYVIQENDKVMCIKNNYHVFNTSGGETAMFNGWTGIVKEINYENMIIDFTLGEAPIIIPLKDVGNYIILGYASTVHRLQGSSADVVIGVLNWGCPPNMASKELVYTLITRAKKKCILIANTGTLRAAIGTDSVAYKRTFLPEMLQKDFYWLRAEYNKSKKKASDEQKARMKEIAETAIPMPKD